MGFRVFQNLVFRAFRSSVIGLALVAGTSAMGQEATFMGSPIDGEAAEYLALKTANLRDKPDTNGAVLGAIDKGARVLAAGRVKGSAWLAITGVKDEKPGEKGFAYAPVFLPLIDGALKEDLSTSVKIPDGPTCEITIVFEGKNFVEDDMLEISDYEAIYQCEDGGEDLVFTAYMFITEAPYDLSLKPHYQVNVDLREVGVEYDETFSSVFIYEREKGRIVFDSATLKEFRKTPGEKIREVATIADVISAAAEIAPTSWNKKVWDVLREVQKLAP